MLLEIFVLHIRKGTPFLGVPFLMTNQLLTAPISP